MELEEPDWDGACSDFTRCAELDPSRDIALYQKRGRCAVQLGDLTLAKADADYYMKLLEEQSAEEPTDTIMSLRI